MKLKLNFEDWDYNCSDGCCYESGIKLYINDVLVTMYADNRQGIIDILEHLGYQVEIV